MDVGNAIVYSIKEREKGKEEEERGESFLLPEGKENTEKG